MLDVAQARAVVHHPVRLDDHRPVVPAVRHDEVPARPLDGLIQVPGIRGIERERLLAHHVRTGLQRGLRLLVVVAGRAADHDDVGLGLEDLAPIRGRLLEAELVLDPPQQVRVPPVHDRELDLVLMGLEVRQMRADGPRSRADDAQTQLRHRAPPIAEDDPGSRVPDGPEIDGARHPPLASPCGWKRVWKCYHPLRHAVTPTLSLGARWPPVGALGSVSVSVRFTLFDPQMGPDFPARMRAHAARSEAILGSFADVVATPLIESETDAQRVAAQLAGRAPGCGGVRARDGRAAVIRGHRPGRRGRAARHLERPVHPAAARRPPPGRGHGPLDVRRVRDVRERAGPARERRSRS